MTAPARETLESEKDKFFVTDAELIRRLGAPEKIARAAIYIGFDQGTCCEFNYSLPRPFLCSRCNSRRVPLGN
jgi:hypothetical protein